MAHRAFLIFTCFAIACGETDTDNLDANTGVDRGVGDAGVTDLGGFDTGFVVDTGIVPDSGAPACPSDPSCASCSADGQCCFFSINCQAGSICNQPLEPLYDSTRPDDVCIRVLCAGPADCAAPKICGPAQVCVDPVCVIDADCTGGAVCIGGRCQAPSPIDECITVQRGIALVPGSAVPVEVVARSAGRGVPARGISLSAAALPGVVTGTGQGFVAGATPGSATISAETTAGPTCSGSSLFNNYGARPAGSTRVVVTSELDGLPIEGASVTIQFASANVQGSTGVDGLFSSNVEDSITFVTVLAPGSGAVTVVAPGSNDLVIPLPVFTPTLSSGVYGKVDMSAVLRRDIQVGFAGTALPSSLRDLGFTSMLTGAVDTLVNAPELGLDNELINLSEGSLLGLGNRDLTGDSTRCQSIVPGGRDVGCFIARTTRPVGAVFTVVSELRLADVAQVANEQAGIFGLMLASAGDIGHGLNGYRTFSAPAPFVPKSTFADCSVPANLDSCRPDYAQFGVENLEAEAVPRVLSVVDIPALASFTNCDREVNLMAVVSLPGRGLVPLGFASARQELDSSGGCSLASPLPPFRPQSLGPNQMALSTAAPHQGAEDHPVFLAALILPMVAGEPASPFGPVNLLVRRGPLSTNVSLSSAAIAMPQATISAGRVDFGTPITGDLLVLDLATPAQRHRLYAPAGLSALGFDFPVTPGVLSLTGADSVEMSAVDLDASYADLFRIGSGVTLEVPEAILDRAATTPCGADFTCSRQ